MPKRDPSAPPSYSQLLDAMRNGQVKQLELLPRQDMVLVEFKDGTNTRVNVFPNDQEVLQGHDHAKALWRVCAEMRLIYESSILLKKGIQPPHADPIHN